MPLISTKQILQKARRGHYAVGAFNVYNLETVQAVIESAQEKRSPVIIAVTEHSAEYAGVDYLVAIVRTAAAKSRIPISLHLDHGKDLELIKRCISEGFTSVMIDGSHLPFEENIAITKKVVKMAHAKKVAVEGELGKISGIEDNAVGRHSLLTDPDAAVEFVKRTGVDSLAVAIGTSHGAFKFKDKVVLDFERLKRIRMKVNVPLVLHGASEIPPELLNNAARYGIALEGAKGVDADSIRKACKFGICKINIDTDLRIAYTEAMREFLATNPQIFDPRKISGYAKEAVKMMVMAKTDLFGSAKKS